MKTYFEKVFERDIGGRYALIPSMGVEIL